MQNLLTDRELLEALADEVESNLRRHIAVADGWQPHDYVPWDDGRNFAFLGGEDWTPEQSELGEIAKLALTVSVLIADNLPSYHREIGKYLRTGPWWRWVGRWTAEENRHEILIRNYLMVTRSVDPVDLERQRMAHMTAGFRRPALHLLDVLANAAFEEAASAIRHRNTAALNENPMVTAIAERIAADDELQSVFFADLVAAAFAIAPDQTMRAIADRVAGFEVPSVALPDGRSSDEVLAEAGIYDRAKEGELVFAPLLRRWNVFDRADLGSEGEAARAELEHLRVFSPA
ncbi:acyl-[acyl-carrier-protein] desaturase [Nocardia amikacinitolerans]|uniref:Acyl-[acyl-carrier-protein] desaturase n=1 Tax=Nocardia amikacinitolerans TaxID=756689 RepID=A0A285L7D3_9NOCA|nr:acyl-ACP desaturase [Nocardia amikacinitolerans]MCP2275051.1 acyl-[acyl-carrier-protein] desaturase [Nocardia amikacinitolerans]MCP2296208.1 acyl-[acyl-carrier-protein] desaturase [Nocardia amikacinitolerans]MCP2316351.1 acyl-[acyl-carrier-protein] desaturase [Nocardia amikacinitolerans]SNY80840.1 acyl-[acyl-carrier-protein] desaturase [Nocardia amikacinitolerans]